MALHNFPAMDTGQFADTKQALHRYSQVLGNWLKTCRSRRKHWWHASLRPSLNGLTTGVVHADIDFELELNLRESKLTGLTSEGKRLVIELYGQPVKEIAGAVSRFLLDSGLDENLVTSVNTDLQPGVFEDYSVDQCRLIYEVLNAVSATFESFRAGIREETSPIQLWPHHFDVSMLWLPGDKIPDQDPANEEYADKQMNFGFTFGDDSIPEPYFYITAYPLPEELPNTPLPEGTGWYSDSFNGAVLTYKTLQANTEPTDYLLALWNGLLIQGRKYLQSSTG